MMVSRDRIDRFCVDGFTVLLGLLGLVVYGSAVASVFGTSTIDADGLTTTTADPYVGVVAAAIFGAICMVPAAIAGDKGRETVVWWVYAVWLFPVALIHALIVKPTLQARDAAARAEGRIPCSFCAEYIRREAITCRWCGKDVEQPYRRSA